MSPKEIILEQLKTTHNQKGWLVSFKDAVTELSISDAARVDPGGSSSIWGIVDHMIFWNSRWLVRLKGGVPEKMEIDNSRTFDVKEINEENWNSSVNKLSEILSEVIKIVENSTDEFLNSEAFPGYGASWYEMFAQYTLHNAYHIGQIVQMRKTQGSWNADYGIKG